MRRSATAALVAALAALAGCGPGVLLDRPADWPDQWRGRRLYNTANAYIYAGSEAIAGEADRLAISVARQFESQTGGKATKGLIIVSDPADGEPFAEPKWMFMTFARMQAQQKGQPPPNQQQLQEGWDKLTEQISKPDMRILIDLDTMFLVKPITLDSGELCDGLGFSKSVAAAVNWAVALPSRALASEFINTMLAAALKQEDVGVGERMLLATVRPLVISAAADSAAKECEIALFERMASCEPDWPELRKRREVAYYRKLKTKSNQRMFGTMFSGQAPGKAKQVPDGEVRQDQGG